MNRRWFAAAGFELSDAAVTVASARASQMPATESEAQPSPVGIDCIRGGPGKSDSGGESEPSLISWRCRSANIP